MSYQIIPLTSDPNQILTPMLSIDGKNKSLTLSISFNEAAGYWVMDIGDPLTGLDILAGIPLLNADKPTANVLGQYAYLGVGSAYVVPLDNVSMDSPDDTNLGTDFLLVWGDTPDD